MILKILLLSEKQLGQIILIVTRSTNGKDLISQSKFESSFMKMFFLKTYSLNWVKLGLSVTLMKYFVSGVSLISLPKILI